MESKFALYSKTIIGLIVLVAGIYMPGIDKDALSSELATIAEIAVQLIGAVLVVWGRVKADTPIHFVPKALKK